MKINQRKTKILMCGKQQMYASTVLDGVSLEAVQNYTCLGSTYLGTGEAIQTRYAGSRKPNKPTIKRNIFLLEAE